MYHGSLVLFHLIIFSSWVLFSIIFASFSSLIFSSAMDSMLLISFSVLKKFLLLLRQHPFEYSNECFGIMMFSSMADRNRNYFCLCGGLALLLLILLMIFTLILGGLVTDQYSAEYSRELHAHLHSPLSVQYLGICAKDTPYRVMHTSETWSWETFSVKGQMVNILGFAGHMVSAATIQLCHYSLRATTICK